MEIKFNSDNILEKTWSVDFIPGITLLSYPDEPHELNPELFKQRYVLIISFMAYHLSLSWMKTPKEYEETLTAKQLLNSILIHRLGFTLIEDYGNMTKMVYEKVDNEKTYTLTITFSCNCILLKYTFKDKLRSIYRSEMLNPIPMDEMADKLERIIIEKML